jgi:hypothetical protein
MVTGVESTGGTDPPGSAVWVVEDEAAAAALASDLCDAAGLHALVFRSHLPFVAALDADTAPLAVVLDWRLEHQLSAGIFMATRHRFPELPVIYWTAAADGLPDMIRDDPCTAVVDKAGGVAAFEGALAWALAAAAEPRGPRLLR